MENPIESFVTSVDSPLGSKGATIAVGSPADVARLTVLEYVLVKVETAKGTFMFPLSSVAWIRAKS